MQHTVFHDIVSGTIPSYMVYDDNQFYAFLDIFPRTKGHTLVIPKKHYEWTYDVPNFGEYWEAVKKITQAIQRSLNPTWVNYFTYGEIPYAHVHILPRYTKAPPSGDAVVPSEILKFSKEEFEEVAEKIRKELRSE